MEKPILQLPIDSESCLKIDNNDQYKQVRHFLRNPSMEFEGNFPIYFEKADSSFRGSSVGVIFEPIGTWSKQSLKVIPFDSLLIKPC